MLNNRNKRRITLLTVFIMSSILAVTSLAYKMDAAYVPKAEIGPGIAQELSETETTEESANIMDNVQSAETSEETEALKQPLEESKPDYIIQSGGRELDLRKPMIALTFDDGPQSKVGNEIMDSLEAYDGRATFFIVGERVSSRQEVVKRMVENGHEIGNHSMNHKYLQKLDAQGIRNQVEACNNIVEEVTGIRPVLMRLPGGIKNETVMQNIGMPVILWNIDTRDWATKNAAKTVESVVGKVKDGDIVLMHELYSETAEAVRKMLPKLNEQGFQFVTVSELIKFKGKTVENNKIYYSFNP